VSFIFNKFNVKQICAKFSGFKALKSALNFVKSNKTFVKIASFSLVGLLALFITLTSVGIKIGFKVNYSGKVIATISDTSVFENAKSVVAKNVNSKKADKAVSKPVFLLTLTTSDKLTSASDLADKIIKNSKEIALGSELVVNGETVICTEGNGLWDLAEARLTEYYVEGAENSASYIDLVEVKEGYYLKSELKNVFDAQEIIDNLDVKTVSTLVTKKTVGYPVRKIKSSAYEKGYHEVTKKGQNGVTHTTLLTETINGVATVENQITKQVITEPVEQVEVIGTAIPKVTATEKANASSKGFINPLNPGTYRITSYYGDGRNHKGMDLAANKGVAIFAVSGGVVSYAGYDSDYGYNIIIDHGNGIKTRYAHANALCVSKGNRVSQGDMIATVGNTGYSSGNHLHFEVIVNGTRVNPAPYIGL